MQKDETPPDKYLSDPQLCEKLHVTPRTTARWRASGEGPPFVRAGGARILYRERDVETWLAARTYAHRAAEMSKAGRPQGAA